MLLAVLLTAGLVGLLVAAGRFVDELLGAEADRWAGRVGTPDAREPAPRRGGPT